MIRHLALSFLFTVLALSAFAQKPNTDIYLFDMARLTDGSFVFANGKYLTVDNKNGYNNQPSFFGTNNLYFASGGTADTSQTEIMMLDFGRRTKHRVTKTIESEYSPQLSPNKSYFTAVRVEKKPGAPQRLWQFPVDRTSKGVALFPTVKNVGYHLWLDMMHVALVLVEPDGKLSLSIGNTATEELQKVAINVGRALGKTPNGDLIYIQTAGDGKDYLKAYNRQSLQSTIITKAVAGSEDFTLLRDGSLLMGKGTKLYHFEPGNSKTWNPVAEFRRFRFGKIQRLALSPGGKLAMVVE